MASTYSPALRLELMATGDQSGTWGDTTNTNLGTLLEQAITGVLSVAEGDTTLTLTANNGASDQSRNAVINLTGAMTGARNVVVPTSNKLYLVKNSTTGGYAVTVKTAAGTGIAVAAGTSRWVYCDGTNVVDGIVGTLAAQVASAVAITGGTITGLTSLTLASGVASPATNDAAALGTGSLSWSNLFLASGGLINWANGDAIITHSTGILTVSTGDLRVTTAGTNAASVVTVGGTQTLTNKTLTSPTINTPTITAPALGVATATSINKVAITAPATSATLTITDGQTLSYTEGTWTPAFSASGSTFSHASQVGTYTKIGNRVLFTFRISLNGTGNTLTASGLSITGFPFSTGSTPSLIAFPIAWFGSTTSYISMAISFSNGTTSGQINGQTVANTGSLTAINASTALSTSAGSVMYGSGVYSV